MNAFRRAALLAGLCLILASPAAWAAEPTGEWVGTLHMPSRDYRLGLRVSHDASGDHATYDWLDLGIRNVSLDRVGGRPDLVFRRGARQGIFTAHWDPALGWRGEWLRQGHPYSMIFRPGVLPPAPLISKADRIAFSVVGAVIVLEAAGIARLLQLRRRRRRQRASAA
jgi:hypothetical protein